ncbi:MAG TPA: 8-amino-7-oxononanoate synthase [Mariprofundaceae bacterium]|nr:8-amino-7-oxononanoate synthase [Mariprofundaceae bacterium]
MPAQRRRRFNAGERQGIAIALAGHTLINFASNDYLGLANHPEVCAAAIWSIESKGLGSGASRLVSGDDPSIHQLEEELAAWKDYEACLIVGSGMLANMGLLQALADRHTQLFADKLNHASLVDGARLSGATVYRYSHLDYVQLQGLLQKQPGERNLIVSDGVFSMDGDCADVAAMLSLAAHHDALLVIDDAHGIGTLGDGRGLTAKAKIAGHPRLIEVGTFGKAFGGYGAFILGSHELIDGLRQRLRTMFYSTALPASIFDAMLVSLNLIKQGELTRKLQANILTFRELTQGLPLLESHTAIQPLMLGSDDRALDAAEALLDAGFFVPAIRPPTVPEGMARLRITLSAAHTSDQIERLATALRELV